MGSAASKEVDPPWADTESGLRWEALELPPGARVCEHAALSIAGTLPDARTRITLDIAAAETPVERPAGAGVPVDMIADAEWVSAPVVVAFAGMGWLIEPRGVGTHGTPLATFPHDGMLLSQLERITDDDIEQVQPLRPVPAAVCEVLDEAMESKWSTWRAVGADGVPVQVLALPAAGVLTPAFVAECGIFVGTREEAAAIRDWIRGARDYFRGVWADGKLRVVVPGAADADVSKSIGSLRVALHFHGAAARIVDAP